MAITDSTRVCGVYKITCSDNNKFYIGSSVNIKNRWASHRHMLRHNKHGNMHLQNAWNKYGESSFSFLILEKCSDESVTEREQEWIDKTGCLNPVFGMNNSPTASTSVGFKHADATKVTLSELAKKRDHTHLRLANEARKGLPSHNRGVPGKKWTDEQKSFASSYRKGKPSWNKGVPHTDEAKRKISKSTIGLHRKFTDLQRDEVKKLRSEGLTYSKISLAVGISLSNCSKIFHDNTGKYKPIGGMRSFDKTKGVASR